MKAWLGEDGLLPGGTPGPGGESSERSPERSHIHPTPREDRPGGWTHPSRMFALDAQDGRDDPVPAENDVSEPAPAATDSMGEATPTFSPTQAIEGDESARHLLLDADITNDEGRTIGDDFVLPSAAEIDLDAFDFPITLNEEVWSWIDFFLTSGRTFFTGWLARSTLYLPMIESILREEKAPRDLAYVAMIESGFSPAAKSSQRATGMWQIMRPTGEAYGIEINRWVDERRDPEKATRAAVRLLLDLHDRFGDWYLALAAYNGGPGRVARAIERAGTTDYWTLARGRYLRPETRDYVPKMIAATVIARNPARFGLYDIPYEEPITYDEAPVEPGTDLVTLAARVGVEVQDLVDLNPELKNWRTPPGRYALKLPEGRAMLMKMPASGAPEGTSFIRHRIAPGDTLLALAHRYRTSVRAIRKANGMKGSFLRAGRSLLIPVSSAPTTELPDWLLGDSDGDDGVEAGLKSRHSQGEKRGTGTRQGGKAPVAASAATKTRARRTGKSAAGSRVIYATLRPGETPGHLARRYGVSTRQLLAWNGIDDPRRIRAGRKLIVGIMKGDTNGALFIITYRVRPGDSPWTIARRFNVHVSDLVEWNALDLDKPLQIGQVLSVRLAPSAGGGRGAGS